MTIFYGDNADKLLVDAPRNLLDAGEGGGKIKVLLDSRTFTAVITTTDSLRMGGPLPEGATVLDVILQHPDLGTTGDFNIGWEASADGGEAADADGFGAAVDVNAAAGSYSMREDQPQAAGMYKKFTEPVQPVIEPSENTTATSGTIDLAIYYIVD